MSENKNRMNSSEREESNNKTELANRIANQSKMMADKSQNILDNLLKLIRWFSTMIDRTLFNTRHAKLFTDACDHDVVCRECQQCRDIVYSYDIQ